MAEPTIADYLMYADLQMAAEAFIRDPNNQGQTTFNFKTCSIF